MKKSRTNILNLCGQTPLVQLNHITQPQHAKILLKLERMNAGGSIKDRPAKYIIEKAEKSGILRPGGVIIESSSGNFGIACAMIGAVKGYKVIILIDPKTTTTNRALMNAYGAQTIVVTEKDDDGAYHKTRIAMAQRLHQEIPNSFWPNQCFNLDNSAAHYASTAPEIMQQCNGEIDVLITAVSTGGQIGGLARYFREHSPKTKIVAVDAFGSTAFGGQAQNYLLPGVGLGWTPANIKDLSQLDAIFKIHDNDTFLTCRVLAKYEGILTGGSTGANVITALHLSKQLNANQQIVCISADSGERYLDTIYNDQWLLNHNLQTECSIAELNQKAQQLVSYSTNPVESANYMPHVVDSISELAANITFNSTEKNIYNVIKAR
ncbi:MAG: cysteine synthase family protein [Burkholderiales bacterium]|nr:cysteine synthase family protein [Burkholderiales bacterium]